jgi:uncharacterized membrane protein YdjX (TVP38/TMEM64 family)
MTTFRRLWPLLPIAAIIAVVFSTGLWRELSWASLATHEQQLQAFSAEHETRAAAAYIALYIVVVAASIPGAVWLTIAGGLMFDIFFGVIFAVIGAGTGAVLIFLAARSALGGTLAERARPLLDKIRPGLERDGFSYLLAVRLVPVVPFWLTNLAPALVGMRLAPYAAATFLGIIPGTIVFSSIGAGLASVLRAGQAPDLSVIFSAPVLLPLLGLALLSLVPVAWRRLHSARSRA